ncbi:roundabout homolog 2-like [Mytilus edulis]|uniref:roundabout homolog 2-like n=1 Tax=Mytilus edulis TaxID=6550 RepID=UPI0039EE40A3
MSFLDVDVLKHVVISANVTQYYPILLTTVTLHCNVKQGTASTIRWLKDGSAIAWNSRISGGTITTESLTITNVQTVDGGNYVCQATDALYNTIVNTDTIIVSPVAGEPVTNIPLSSYTQIIGKPIILGCTVSSPHSPLQEVQWTFNNKEGEVTDPIAVSTFNGKYSGSRNTSPSLIINNVTIMDEGIYSCKARNIFGTSKNNPTTTLNVTGSFPVIEISPTIYIAAYGNQVVIYCNISSASPAVSEVYWQRSTDNQVLKIYNGDVGYQGSSPTIPSLTINFAATANAGTYICVARNEVGTSNSNTATLTIIGGLLSVHVTPRTSNVAKEKSKNISCNVTGTPALTCITWLFKLAESTQQLILNTTNRNKYTVGSAQEHYLTVLNFQPGDSGTYICRATNAAGSSSSNPGSTLSYISEPITSVEPSQYAAKVDDANFKIHCYVTATPGAFDWYWTFQSVGGTFEIINKGTNSQEYIIENSGRNPHLTIRNIALNKTGMYTCFAMNTAGTSVSTSDSKHTLTVAGDSTILCGKHIDKFDTKWGITAENNLLTLPCNGNYTGSVSRYCSNGGKWMEPDYSQCMHKTIQNIHAQSAKLLSGKSIDTFVSTLLESLENITSGNNELRTGDLVTLSAVLNDIARYVTEHPEKLSINQLEVFGSVCNNVLDERNHQSWEELNDQGSSGVTSVVKAVTVYNGVFHKVIQGEFAMIIQKENIVTEVGKTISDEITVPDRLKTSLSWITDSAFEIKLKKSSHHDLTGYSSTFYRNVSRFFPKYLMLNG